MKTLDMLGQPCPIPVITARKELDKPEIDGVMVLVDNIVAVQNLEKMAKGTGRKFSYTQEGGNYRVTVQNAGNAAFSGENNQPDNALSSEGEGVTVLLKSNQLGDGSEDLGKILVKGFLFSLTELPVAPKAVVLMNSGVRLACGDSNTIPDLQALTAKGTRVLACGTCLNYYKLSGQLAVGEIVDMFAITGQLASAAKLITL